VVKRPAGDAQAAADLGQLQSAIAEVGQHVEACFEVGLARQTARHVADDNRRVLKLILSGSRLSAAGIPSTG
jgi:hypothetical protein